MAIDTTLLTDYTWAQIKLGAKHAMLSAAVGGSALTIKGRTIGRITIAEATRLYNFADEMEQIEGNGESGRNVLVEFGEIS